MLIIGGGDGAVANELLRYKGIQSVVMCELDAKVVETSKKFFPQWKWDDPRLKVLHMDGAKFVADNPNTFDVIIVDSSDPVGPAESLYTEKFYQVCCQERRGVSHMYICVCIFFGGFFCSKFS